MHLRGFTCTPAADCGQQRASGQQQTTSGTRPPVRGNMQAKATGSVCYTASGTLHKIENRGQREVSGEGERRHAAFDMLQRQV